MAVSTAWTRRDFLAALSPLGCTAEPRPPEFSSYTRQLRNKTFTVDSAGWRVADGKACARYARITGPAMDIATVMLYPTQSPDLLPVFAAEWVVFGDTIHTLVLDVEPCGDQLDLIEELRETLSPKHRHWIQTFPLNRDKPDWFKEIETPWALFGQAPGSKMVELRAAFQAYLDPTIELYEQRLPRAWSGDDHPAVRDYKHHHYINSPGHRILGVKFGEQHTDCLLRDWHFGPAQPVESQATARCATE